jgi:hypothetical protein
MPSRSATRSHSAIDRRVLELLLVADLRLGHRPPHRRHRARLGVRGEVDERAHRGSFAACRLKVA